MQVCTALLVAVMATQGPAAGGPGKVLLPVTTMRLRGGATSPAFDPDGCSAGVSDRGLLEAARDEGEDESMQEYRAAYRESARLRMQKLFEVGAGDLLRSDLKELGTAQPAWANDPDVLRRLLKAQGSREPREAAPAARAAGDLNAAPASRGAADSASIADRLQRWAALDEGVRLSESDLALLRQDAERCASSGSADAARGASDEYATARGADGAHDPLARRQRRLGRIKALLRCKAAALTLDACSAPPPEGIVMPSPLDIHVAPAPGAAPPRPADDRGAEAEDSVGRTTGAFGAAEAAAAATTPAMAAPERGCSAANASAGGSGGDGGNGCCLTPLEHPYLVVRGPESSTLLYECEAEDLAAGVRDLSLRPAHAASLSAEAVLGGG